MDLLGFRGLPSCWLRNQDGAVLVYISIHLISNRCGTLLSAVKAACSYVGPGGLLGYAAVDLTIYDGPYQLREGTMGNSIICGKQLHCVA